MRTEMGATTGVADFLDWLTANLAGFAGSTINFEIGDEATKRAIRSAIIARRSSFLLDRKF